jgi:CRISPR-associated protein Cmr5
MGNLNNTNLEVSKFSLDCVKKCVDEKEIKVQKEYKTLVKKMPTLIQKNGFINTLVFLLSKSKSNEQHEIVIKNIIDWSKKNKKIEIFLKLDENGCDFEKYINKINNITDNYEYRLITKEMMILFGWIKRFADAMIEKED